MPHEASCLDCDPAAIVCLLAFVLMRRMGTRHLLVVSISLALGACATQKPKLAPVVQRSVAPTPQQKKGRAHPPPFVARGGYTAGGLYAPGVADTAPDVPEDISELPEPVPSNEPRSRYGNRTPYLVLGKTYNVLPSPKGYVERGVASWYGTKFDGRPTSNFEAYDMYKFSGAHRTLPLPSYARVTNLDNGRSVIVRINDRGPFHEGRLIDLSYAAAVKLGVTGKGTAPVEVRAVEPGDDAGPPPVAQALVPAKSPDGVPAGGTRIAAVVVAQVDSSAAGSIPSKTRTNNPPASASSTPLPPASWQSYPSDADTGMLQLGSFGERANADRLVQRLQQAGIAGASVRETQVDARPLWRVVIDGIDSLRAAALVERIESLGLGHPAFIRAPRS